MLSSRLLRLGSLLTPCALALAACAAEPDARVAGGSGGASPGGDGALPQEYEAGSEPDAGATGNSSQEGGDEREACADVETTPVRTIPSVTFLVDGSGSMDCVYPEDPACDCESQIRKTCTAQGTQSRWQALAQALFGDGTSPGVVDSLGGVIRFGLWIYNDAPSVDACPGFPAQVAPALDQAGQLAAAFPSAPPGYNTPTALALAALAQSLPDTNQAAAQMLGPQNIVLATDGQPFTCLDRVLLLPPQLDYQAVLNAADAARAKDIDVFVMSLSPASGDFASHLEEVAQRGNSARAYTPGNRAQLAEALEQIIASAISCTVTLQGKVQRPERCDGTATLGGQPLTCNQADGFRIVDESHVELLGSACQRFKREPGIELKMTFPCEQLSLQ